MRFNLIYLSPNNVGGWVTYTQHLYHALADNGHEVHILKVRDRGEGKQRNFGFGLTYRNVTLDDLAGMRGIHLITALAKNFAEVGETLVARGAWIVCHDPTEIKNLPDNMPRMIVIRRVGLEYFPHATFIPHPYKRHRQDPRPESRYRRNAVSVSRIDFDKHTHILLDANRLLPEKKRIHIHGFENRLYTKFKIMPEYPEWEQSKVAYPREEGAAFGLLRGSNYMCDMSVIKGDGGGSQYTFLEAMDAGAVCVLNRQWITNVPSGDEMRPGINCIVVSDGEELARVLRKPAPKLSTTLPRHNHKKIGAAYADLLG